MKPSAATIRILALIALAAAEIWGVLHFWSDAKIAQFLLGSVAIWLVALFVFWKAWFGEREITFGEYGWFPFALLSVLEAHRGHERSLEILWLVIFAILAVEIVVTIVKGRPKILNQSHVPSSLRNAAGSRMPYLVSGLIYISALAWMGQFLPGRLPPWARITLLVPALPLIVRVFLPNRWFQRSTDSVHTLNSSANGARP